MKLTDCSAGPRREIKTFNSLVFERTVILETLEKQT